MLVADAEFANFADNSTIYAARNSIEERRKESKSATDWFKITDMIVNPDKFQVMVMSCDKKENKHNLTIYK